MSEAPCFYTKPVLFWGFPIFAPLCIKWQGIYLPTAAHYFQGQKVSGAITGERIRTAATANEPLAVGQIREYRIHKDWNAVREVMVNALSLNFSGPEAKTLLLLLLTGKRTLVEASPVDRILESCQDGSGLNRLGNSLVPIRFEPERSGSQHFARRGQAAPRYRLEAHVACRSASALNPINYRFCAPKIAH